MSNSESYDPRMEDLPLVVSYPRSGSTWINSVMELYFNRPRLRNDYVTFLPDRKRRTDYMWFHDHDIHSDLKISHDNILYLYRKPVDVIFSIIKAEFAEFDSVGTDLKNTIVNTQIERLGKQYRKYLLGGSKVQVQYEKLIGDDCHSEFDKIIRFLDESHVPNHSMLDELLSRTTRREVIKRHRDPRYFSRALLLQPYRDARAKFADKYGERINSTIDNTLMPYFYGDTKDR